MLWKYFQDPSRLINHKTLDVQHDLTHEETSMVILDRKIHVLRIKEIPSIKSLFMEGKDLQHYANLIFLQ